MSVQEQEKWARIALKQTIGDSSDNAISQTINNSVNWTVGFLRQNICDNHFRECVGKVCDVMASGGGADNSAAEIFDMVRKYPLHCEHCG